MSKSKKSTKEFNLFFVSLGTRARRTISHLLERKEKLKLENQKLQDERQGQKHVIDNDDQNDCVQIDLLPKDVISSDRYKSSSKFLYWFKLLSKFISVQLIVQFISAISGFILIRTLSKEDFAYFTIANSMQGVMNLLADSGVSVGLSAIGGKVWQDRYRFGQLINTAMELRRWFALVSTIIVTPIMIWLLISNNASITYTFFITVAVLVELHFYLEIAVLGTIPRLHSQVSFLQNLDLVTTISRLTLIVAAYFFYLNAAVATFISTISSGLQSFLLRKTTPEKINIKAEISQDDRKYILGIVKNLLPSAVFHSIQGQLTVVLIGIFGNTQQIAEVGALGRLAVLFSVMNSVMSSIVLPSFARCQSKTLLRKRYLQIVLGFVGIGVIVVVLTAIFPKQLLWILGSKYSNLDKELIWMMSSSVVASIGGVMWSLCSTKGWVDSLWIGIVLIVLVQICMLNFGLNLSNVKGVITFRLISDTIPILVSGFLAYKGLFKKIDIENINV